jgi:hypothetical protein
MEEYYTYLDFNQILKEYWGLFTVFEAKIVHHL